MKNTLALIGAAVLTFAVLGYYLGWYSITSTQTDASGHRSVTIDLNARKIGADLEKGSDKLQSTINEVAKDDKSKAAKKDLFDSLLNNKR